MSVWQPKTIFNPAKRANLGCVFFQKLALVAVEGCLRRFYFLKTNTPFLGNGVFWGGETVVGLKPLGVVVQRPPAVFPPEEGVPLGPRHHSGGWSDSGPHFPRKCCKITCVLYGLGAGEVHELSLIHI